MAEFDEISNEERLQIVQHFMLSSPPGQFKDVSDDAKKLIPSGVLTEPLETGIARAYNNKNNKVVTTPSGATATLSAAGEVDATHYVDTSNGSVFAVNHITMECHDDQIDSNMDASIELKRAALQASVDKYMKECYLDSNSAGCVYAKDGSLKVVITGEKTNLRNFWGGKWNSVWNVEWTVSTTTVTGDIKVHAHYFEDGNVQLQSAKNIEATAISDGAFTEAQADAIVTHIKNKENELNKNLDKMYFDLDQQTFKTIRRILPVTKLKMDWNVNSANLTSSLQAGLK